MIKHFKIVELHIILYGKSSSNAVLAYLLHAPPVAVGTWIAIVAATALAAAVANCLLMFAAK